MSLCIENCLPSEKIQNNLLHLFHYYMTPPLTINHSPFGKPNFNFRSVNGTSCTTLLILTTRFSYHFHMFPLILLDSSRGKPTLTFPRKLLLTARFWFPLPPFAVFRKTVTPFLHSLGTSVPITTFQFLFSVLWLDSLLLKSV